jgi:hypothetical protein
VVLDADSMINGDVYEGEFKNNEFSGNGEDDSTDGICS